MQKVSSFARFTGSAERIYSRQRNNATVGSMPKQFKKVIGPKHVAPQASRSRGGYGTWAFLGVAVLVLISASVLFSNRKPGRATNEPGPTAGMVAAPGIAAGPPAKVFSNLASALPRTSAPPAVMSVSNLAAPTNALAVIEVNQALMVTVELDFGPKPPRIAEALREIERRSQPEDGQGRTFAVLDAYGEPTPQGKLHLSMHVSMEKPGLGSLVFRRTGEMLWQSRIVAGTNAAAFTGKNLLIYMDDGAGKPVTIDGSQNPLTILEATVKEAGGVPVNLFWPDGAEREFTFLYSACGCPVKVMARREGSRTARTKDLPVIFPDDPAAVAVINRLMRW
jgi:hypothetical protein